MAIRSDGLRTKNRILSSCVRLFLENGYNNTTMMNICEDAKISTSSFFNLFESKDGVLLELMQFMYENQFNIAQNTAGSELPPVFVYAVETAIQITLTELNENLCDIYLEVYTQKRLLDYVQSATAKELYRIFGSYSPELTEQDFLYMDFGSAGLMRGYLANPCTENFSLEKKISTFLLLALRGYNVPSDEISQVLAFIAGLDIRSISQKVMENLFRKLAMRYDFSLSGLLPND